MFVRVQCTRCRLAPAWTDDADGLLGTVCDRPFHCEGRLRDESDVDVTETHMAARAHALFHAIDGAPPRPSAAPRCHREPASIPVSRLVTIALASIAAWVICAALLAGYASAAVASTLVVLCTPALAALYFVRPGASALFGAAAALSLAALGIDLLGAGAVSTSPIRGALIDVVSVAFSLAANLPRPERIIAWSDFFEGVHGWRTAALSFAAAAVLLLGVGFPQARRLARREDAGLIRSLALRTKAEGNELVIGGLPSKLASLAQQRVAVVADGELYDLADAHLGADDLDDRVTLVLPLRTPSAPSRIEFDGLRGPTTTYRQTIELASR